MSTRAYVLHSGGLDSSALLAHAVSDNLHLPSHVVSVGVDYGQRHRVELNAAANVAAWYGVERMVVAMPGLDSLLTSDAPLPDVDYADLPEGISPTYVPFRNGRLLALVAGLAQEWVMQGDKVDHTGEAIEKGRQAVIYFGAHAEDAARWAYPDCTPEFIGAMANAIYVGTYSRVRLVAPWQHMQKSEIVAWADQHRIGTRRFPFEYTWSCYAGGEQHCGTCPTCRSRKQAFIAAAVQDPTEYAQ